MKIAQVAPLWEQVPPLNYGGIELVVSHLTNELVRRGHEVKLFAAGDSQTLAHLTAVCPRALRSQVTVQEYAAYETLELSQVYQQAQEFDLIHSHIGIAALALANLVSTPIVHTLHGSFTSDNRNIFSQHSQQVYVSISHSQRQLYLNYIETVYNGIEVADYPFITQPQQPPYLAFLGRFSPEKGPQHAIAIAKKIGWQLKMAGKVDVDDAKFFAQEIVPHIDGQQIEYLGEINHTQKAQLLGNATVTLFPISWQEPFGLVMIESMATGTPVIAMNRGSVPEVIEHGKTGFICHTCDEMAEMISAALELDRYQCRKYVANKFSVTQMVNKYEDVYQKVMNNQIASHGYIHAGQI